MLDDTIKKMEQGLGALPETKRVELIALMNTLKKEVDALAMDHAEEATSIVGFTQMTAHEVTRNTPEQELVDVSLQGLATSARKFEVTHPEMVGTVNAICHILAKMGL